MTFSMQFQVILSQMNWMDCLKWLNALLGLVKLLGLILLPLNPLTYPIRCINHNSDFNQAISILLLHHLVLLNQKTWIFPHFFHYLKNRRNIHHKGNFSNVLKLTWLITYLIQVHVHKLYNFLMAYYW